MKEVNCKENTIKFTCVATFSVYNNEHPIKKGNININKSL